MMTATLTENFEALEKLNRDLKDASRLLGRKEARYLVDMYYAIQDFRIQSAAQVRASETEEPNRVLDWVCESTRRLEDNIKRALGEFAKQYTVGQWMQCAPPDSLVRTTSSGDIPISELKDGDQVFAYHRKKSSISGKRKKYGHKIKVANRHYSGKMINIIADGKETRTTVNHKWPIHINPDLTCNKFVVYLMRRDGFFRVGRSRLLIKRSGSKNGRLGVIIRARREKADGLWILKTFDHEKDASIYENYVAAFYGIPTVTFEPVSGNSKTFLTNENLEKLWKMFPKSRLLESALSCLIDHQKDIRFPLYSIGNQKKPNSRYLLDVHAINLIPEIMQIPTIKKGAHTKFVPFEMEESWYDGQVYSLDVENHHTYIQDGLCTCNSITGIGPVISAGFLAHLDVRGRNTAGHFWRFAGIDPTMKWEKKQKRPWNAKLKVLCFKVGESFVKVQNNKNDFYGKLYRARKDQEIFKNENLAFRDQAETVLKEKNIGKTTDAYAAYSVGKLPPAHLHARARRYAVSIFLSNLHHVMYEDYYGCRPPVPYVFGMEGHGNREGSYIAPPNWPHVGGENLKRLFAENDPEKTELNGGIE